MTQGGNYYYKYAGVLSSWRIPTCVICKRFLNKFQKKYCNRCAKEVYRKEANKANRKYLKKRYRIDSEYRKLCLLKLEVLTNPDRFNVGDIV